MEPTHTHEALQTALTRQYQFLWRQEGADFLIQLRQWWRFVSEDPLLRGLLEDAVGEANEIANRFRQHEASMADELTTVRQGMVAAHPPMDDSAVTRPDGWQSPLATMNYQYTLAHFDEVAVSAKTPGSIRLSIVGIDDVSATNELINILDRKRDEAQHLKRNEGGAIQHFDEDLVPALDDWALKLVDVRQRHEYFFRHLVLDKEASSGFAVTRLQEFLNDLVPEPIPVKTKADLLVRTNAAIRDMLRGLTDSSISVAQLRIALFASEIEKKHDPKHGKALQQWVTHLRPFVERVYEDLHARLDRRRTLLGLFHRFKTRCEWHDRERLREIASRGKENALTAEFARWLFDEGYTPLTRPLVGDLQPDILEPGHLYVEAKRYSTSARSEIIQGYWELTDGLLRLVGTKFEPREVLFPVFREKGPSPVYVLPTELRCGGFRVFPLLIDIAPTSESGSRQKSPPIHLDAADFERPPQRAKSVATQSSKRRRGTQ